MRTLKLSTSTLDKENTFRISLQAGKCPKTVSLQSGYDKRDDGIIWALNSGAVLQGHYTDADIANLDRLNAMQPVEHEEIVLIEGKQYKTRVLGDFSDCAIFDPIN